MAPRVSAPGSSQVLVPSWITAMLTSQFFVPCETHAHLKKNEVGPLGFSSLLAEVCQTEQLDFTNATASMRLLINKHHEIFLLVSPRVITVYFLLRLLRDQAAAAEPVPALHARARRPPGHPGGTRPLPAPAVLSVGMLAVLSAGIRDALPLGLAIQVRRYVYCDVVRTIDINEFVDIDGIQVRVRRHRWHSGALPYLRIRFRVKAIPYTCMRNSFSPDAHAGLHHQPGKGGVPQRAASGQDGGPSRLGRMPQLLPHAARGLQLLLPGMQGEALGHAPMHHLPTKAILSHGPCHYIAMT